MKKLRRILALFITLIMVLSTLPIGAFAQEMQTQTEEKETSEEYVEAQAAQADIIAYSNQVALSGNYSSAIKKDGSLWTWGRNDNGQLGTGYRADQPSPVQVQGLSDVAQVILGGSTSAAIKKDGTLWIWGNNYFGNFGNGTTRDSNKPVQVQGLTDVAQVALGANHSAAIKKDGTLWTWGWNNYGQLGNGEQGVLKRKTTPIQVQSLTDVVQVAIGGNCSAAIKKDGTLWMWGNNENGNLGIEDTTTAKVSTPTQVKNLTDVAQVALGGSYSAAVKKDGTLWMWGNNKYGQLGTGDTSRVDTPTQVKNITDVVQVDLGDYHSAAIKKDGTLWSWGWNNYGQLGNGKSYKDYSNKQQVYEAKPVQVKNLTDVTQVALGSGHSAALKNDGTLWMWGDNEYGQLGNGKSGYKEQETTPILVSDISTDASAPDRPNNSDKPSGEVYQVQFFDADTDEPLEGVSVEVSLNKVIHSNKDGLVEFSFSTAKMANVSKGGYKDLLLTETSLKLGEINKVYLEKDSSQLLYNLKVVDQVSGEPIVGATVSYMGGKESRDTDNNGLVHINLSNTYTTVDVLKEGYETKTVRKDSLQDSGSQDAVNIVSLLYIGDMAGQVNFDAGTTNVDGPKTQIKGDDNNNIEFTPFQIQTGINIMGFKESYKYNDKDKTVIQTIGLSDAVSQSKKYTEEGIKKMVSSINSVEDFLNKAKTAGIKPIDATFGLKTEAYGLGYIKYDLSSGKPVVKEGSIAIGAGIGKSVKAPIYGVLYVTCNITGDASGKVTFTPISTNANDAQIQMLLNATLKGGLEVGAGGDVGIAGMEGGVGGDLTIDASDIPSMAQSGGQKPALKDVLKVQASLYAYYKWSFIWLENKETIAQTKFDLFPQNAKTQEVLNGKESGFKLMDRSYLNENTASTQSIDGAAEISEKNVLPDGNPQMVTLDDGRIFAAWVSDNGSSNEGLEFMSLVYSIRDTDGNWSTPEEVSKSAGSDFKPVLTSDGIHVYILWTRSTKAMEANTSLSEAMENIVLAETTFDGTSSSFSEVRELTSPGLMPIFYDFDVTENGNVTVGWIQNTANSSTSTTGSNNVYLGEIGNASLVAENIGSVSSFAVNDGHAYYILDGDKDFTTANGSLNTVDTSGQASKVSDSQSAGFVKQIDSQIYWIQDDKLYTLQGSSPVDTGASVSGDYDVLNNNNKLTVLSNKIDGFDSQIYKTEGTVGGEWSYPVAITQADQRITHFDAVIDPTTNEVLVAYDVMPVDDSYRGEEGTSPYGNTDFIVGDLEDQWNLSVTPYLNFDAETFKMGQETTFTAEVTNSSTQPLDSITINLTDGSGKNVGKRTIKQALQVGETKEVSFKADVPNVKEYTLNAEFTVTGHDENTLDNNKAVANLSANSTLDLDVTDNNDSQTPSNPNDTNKPDNPSGPNNVEPNNPSSPDHTQPSTPDVPSNPGQPNTSTTETMPIYRLYNSTSGEHLYTPAPIEVTFLVRNGWSSEGIGWQAPKSGDPVYRLYNPSIGTHLYTMSPDEISHLTSNNEWVMDFDGQPAFYSGGSVPIYRVYLDVMKRHHLTTDVDEYNTLPNFSWQQEGISLYAIRSGK